MTTGASAATCSLSSVENLCCAVLYSALLYSTLLWCDMIWYDVLCYAVLYPDVLGCDVLVTLLLLCWILLWSTLIYSAVLGYAGLCCFHWLNARAVRIPRKWRRRGGGGADEAIWTCALTFFPCQSRGVSFCRVLSGRLCVSDCGACWHIWIAAGDWADQHLQFCKPRLVLLKETVVASVHIACVVCLRCWVKLWVSIYLSVCAPLAY